MCAPRASPGSRGGGLGGAALPARRRLSQRKALTRESISRFDRATGGQSWREAGSMPDQPDGTRRARRCAVQGRIKGWRRKDWPRRRSKLTRAQRIAACVTSHARDPVAERRVCLRSGQTRSEFGRGGAGASLGGKSGERSAPTDAPATLHRAPPGATRPEGYRERAGVAARAQPTSANLRTLVGRARDDIFMWASARRNSSTTRTHPPPAPRTRSASAAAANA
jgi:hypothetical protein